MIGIENWQVFTISAITGIFTGLFAGLGSAIGNYIANKAVIKHLDKIEYKLKEKKV